MDIQDLVAKLQRANWAYHNTDSPLMTDEEYDKALEDLRRLSPAHPFLRVIGAAPEKGSILLPYTMGSLDKVRYGEEGLDRWLRKWPGKLVITEKLDGLSALLTTDHAGKQRLYLRGDGVKGVDVSAACSVLRIPRVPGVIRGEILLPHASIPEGSIGRSLVNGWLHRIHKTQVPEELTKCHFVAYQVHQPAGLTRSQQFTWLRERGFKIPTVKTVTTLTNESAKEILLQMRQESAYPLDGIVIGADRTPLAPSGGEASNPDDQIAFKAALEEQKAKTTIVSIEWNISRQNIYIPRIQIQPVSIGGAKIEWLSGHNAAFVEQNGLGAGAEIIIRRSGDVIPTLDTVLKKVVPKLPDSTTCEWDESHTHLKRLATQEETNDTLEKALLHALQTLEVEGVGPGLVKKLVEGGIRSVKDVLEATPEQLGEILGAGRGPALLTNLRGRAGVVNQMCLLIASNQLPRGVGEKKLRGLFAIQPDARLWSEQTLGTPAGWSKDSIQTLLKSLPAAIKWMEDTFGVKHYEPTPVVAQTTPKRKVCFSGCRPKELPDSWEMIDSVTKACELLVVADKSKETTKTKRAKELGIRIVNSSEFPPKVEE